MFPNGQVRSHTREHPEKGKTTFEAVTALNTAEINTLTDREFDVEKQLEFSEYWHNEEIF